MARFPLRSSLSICAIPLLMGLLTADARAQQAAPAVRQQSKGPVGYVNPFIGAIGLMLTATSPSVQLPYGMMRIVPITTGGPDSYLARQIAGFPAGGVVLMPAAGELTTPAASVASDFDRDFETVTPYYGSNVLDSYDVKVEYTVANRAAFYRIAYPTGSSSHLVLMAGPGGEIAATGRDTVSGFSGSGGVRTYFYAVFSRPFSTSRSWNTAGAARRGSSGRGPRVDGVGMALDFAPAPGERIGVRVGMSYISVEQARRNLLADIPRPNFDQVKTAARATWNRELGKIAVRGGTEKQRTIFYTALYRSMGRPNDMTEEGGQYFSGADGKAHPADGAHFYLNDNFWDTHRTLHPLQTLLDPKRQEAMASSLVRMYEQSGWLPTCPSTGGDRGVMIGHHASPFILDLYRKGFRDFDVEKAYAGMRKNAMEATLLPWRRGPLTVLDRVYLEKGFFPALARGEKETVTEVHPSERRQAVAVTLENCYDDWAVAQLGAELSKGDREYFLKRARNYENLFDKRIGFMAPKSADGNWVEGYDPKLGGGQGGRDYFAEMNGWTYTFHVPHDVAGLIRLMGGREAFVAKLDALFAEDYDGSKYRFLGQFPDSTGLIGQYAQGNEPSFHILYLYNYAGEPWKTQFRLRQAMDMWYGDGPLGIPGDDDGGSTSSWYVFSAMGFYPVTVGVPAYNIGSPIFDEVKLTLHDGKVFTIVAKGVSRQNKYIQSAELNGKPLNRPWFNHSDIAQGGALVLQMGPRPNQAWGSAPDAAPPSITAD